MTNVEAAQLLAIIRVAYPFAYKNFSDDMARDSISMWQSKFETVPFEVMLMAWDKYCMQNKFPPTFADFRECLADVYYRAWLDWTQAKLLGDLAEMERCNYVMEATSQFLGSNDQPLNYNLISEDKLRLSAYNAQCLTKEIEYIE